MDNPSALGHTVYRFLGEMTNVTGKGWKRTLTTDSAKLESTDLFPRPVSGLTPQVQAISC